MLPKYLCALLGANWKTSLSALIFAIASIIVATPEVFGAHLLLMSICKYLAVGAGAVGLHQAMDKPKNDQCDFPPMNTTNSLR
jgi:hypothetical protein